LTIANMKKNKAAAKNKVSFQVRLIVKIFEKPKAENQRKSV